MIKILTLSALLAFSHATHPVNKEIVEEIKKMATTWEPMEVEENPLALLSEEQVMSYLGTFLKDPVVEGHEVTLQEGLALPVNFDGRTHWGSCVHGILNQARCGSCWAFGASEALTDRFCIQSKSKIDNVLSS